MAVAEQLRKQREDRLGVYNDAKAISDKYSGGADWTTEDTQRWDALMGDYDKRSAQIDRLVKIEAAEADLAKPAPDNAPVPRNAPADPDPAKPDLKGKKQRYIATSEYRAAFNRFLVAGGPVPEIRSGPEYRALQMDLDTAGGFAVAPQIFSDQLIKFVDNQVFIRGMATTLRAPNAASLGAAQLVTDPDDADWTTELQTGNNDPSMAFGKREFRPNPLAKLLQVSNKLIRAVSALQDFDEDTAQGYGSIDDLVIARLGYKFGIAQEKAFLTGSGALQPLGVFTASADGIPTTSDVTAAGSTTIVADDLINTKYSLKPQYQAKAVWMWNRTAVQIIRKLKDTNGQYIWAPGAIGQASLTQGQPDVILDVPFYMSEYVPNTFTTGLYVGIIGDFRFYWIVDALDFVIQRLVELYAATNQVGFIGRMELDGMPVLGEAFARVKLA